MANWDITNLGLNWMSPWLNYVLDYILYYFVTLFLLYQKWNDKKFKMELQSNMKFTLQNLEHRSLPKEPTFIAMKCFI